MSNYEAIRKLERFRKVYCYSTKYIWKRMDLTTRSYIDTLITKLIEEIEKHPDEDPIVIIQFMRSDIEQYIDTSDNERTQTFCSHMLQIYDEILERLLKEEK